MQAQRILSIKNVGTINTKDIEVANTNHRYYANNIVVSNSHAVSYAMNAYLSAYSKAHFPTVFFASYLRFAKDKIDPQQEIKELVKNATEMDVEIRIPDFRNLNDLFILKDKTIYFGLTDIKGVGASVYNKILKLVETKNLQVHNLTWPQMLASILLHINSTACKALISCGAFDYFKKCRSELLFEYEIVKGLTDKELKSFNDFTEVKPSAGVLDILRFIYDNIKLIPKRKEIISNYIESLLHPPYSLIDKIEWLADSENELLGAAITCSKLDMYDIGATNCDCKTFKTLSISNNVVIAGEIANINIVKTKSGKTPGQEMAFITIEDQYGSLDSVVFFPESFAKYKNHLFVGNVLVFSGNRSKSKDGLIVDRCFNPAS